MELRTDAWGRFNIWDHSRDTADLYRRRARDEIEEMVCAAQAAELLGELALPGETLLDAGCGAGHFHHSLRRRGIDLAYHGIDATRRFIEIGQAELAAVGLPPDRLRTARIEDVDGVFDHVLCMNVLSNLDNYHRPLERLLRMAGRSLILRESIKDGAEYLYVEDRFLDPGIRLSVHVNAYDRADLTGFIEARGFEVAEVTDRRTGGAPEMVIGYPHYWTFLVARRVRPFS